MSFGTPQYKNNNQYTRYLTAQEDKPVIGRIIPPINKLAADGIFSLRCEVPQNWLCCDVIMTRLFGVRCRAKKLAPHITHFLSDGWLNHGNNRCGWSSGHGLSHERRFTQRKQESGKQQVRMVHL